MSSVRVEGTSLVYLQFLGDLLGEDASEEQGKVSVYNLVPELEASPSP